MAASLNEAANYDLSPLFKDLGLYAASHGFILTAVDSGGLGKMPAGLSAEYGARDLDYGLSVEGTSAAGRSSQDSMALLAEPSGGKAVVNTNDFDKALGQAGLALNQYYILGYQPQHPADGKTHTLAVKTTNPEFTVSSRRGYSDYTEDDSLPLRLRSALQWEDPLENPLSLSIDAGKEKKEGKYFLVPLRIVLKKEALTFKEGKTFLKLGIVTAVGRKKSDTFLQKLVFEEAQWKDKSLLVYEVTLKMQKGDQKLVAGIQDSSGRIGLVKMALTLPRK
jgi:hypothetical protein